MCGLREEGMTDMRVGGKRERTESRECGRKKVRMKVRKWTEKRGCQAGM